MRCALRPLAAAMLLVSVAARAEQVDLVCNAAENIALVRFSVSGESPPVFPRLPQKLDRGLSASAGMGRTDCTLANGTAIRVRSGEEQAFAYGEGGGDPPAFFSLWINQRKVFSRKVWKPGYSESFNNLPIYDGVLIASSRVTICATADGKPQRCDSQPLDLAQAQFDRAEYGSAAQKPPVGHFSVIARGADNQRFCTDYLDSLKPGIDEALSGQKTAFDIDLGLLDTLPGGKAGAVRSGLLDLSPGAARRLMVWSGGDRYFDGTVIAVAPSALTTGAIAAAYPFDDIETWPTRSAPPGTTLVSGGQRQLYPSVSPRYVHLVPQRVAGALYFFAYPTNVKVRPTAALVKPMAEGGFATLCAFNRTEPHY